MRLLIISFIILLVGITSCKSSKENIATNIVAENIESKDSSKETKVIEITPLENSLNSQISTEVKSSETLKTDAQNSDTILQPAQEGTLEEVQDNLENDDKANSLEKSEPTKSSFNINYYIDESLRNSPDVQEVVFNKLESSDLVKQSYLSVLPVITARAGTGSQYYNSPNISNRKLGSDEMSLNLHQNIFGEGNITNVQINKSVFNAKTHELEQARNLITLSTIETYLNVLKYTAIQKIQQNSIDYHKDVSVKIKARLDAGLMRVSDLYLIEARVASAKSNLTNTESQLVKSKNLLLRYSGVKASEELQDFDLPIELPTNFDEAWNISLNSNPIIKAKYQEIKTNDYLRKKELIKLYPSLSADVLARKNLDYSGIDGTQKDVSAMLNVTYDFNFGSQYFRSSASGARAQAARYSYEKYKSDVYQILGTLYNDYAQLSIRIETLKQNQDSLEHTVNKQQQEFDAGFRTLLDLLNTKNEFFNSEIQYVNAIYDRKILAYTILSHSGILLTHFGK